jgi:hypothetical protein
MLEQNNAFCTKRKRVLLVIPDDFCFRRIAAEAVTKLEQSFAAVSVVAHLPKQSSTDFANRNRKVGALRAIDELLHVLLEAQCSPWDKAIERHGLCSELESVTRINFLDSPDFGKFLALQKFDILVGVGCAYLPLYQIPPGTMAVNIHPGILPQYRGVGNPEALLANDGSNMGVSIHLMAKRIDEGRILFTRRMPLLKRLSIPSAYILCYRTGLAMLPSVSWEGASSNHQSREAEAHSRKATLWRILLSRFLYWKLQRTFSA